MKLHPIYEGEFEGRKIGLISDFSLYELSINSEVKNQIASVIDTQILVEDNKFEKFAIEQNKRTSINFCLGFGYGFSEGKRARLIIEKAENNGLTFEENIVYYKILVENSKYCTERINVADDYLNNISNWSKYEIPIIIYEKCISELNNKKIQRAINIVKTFSLENYFLKLLIDNNLLNQKLISIRKKKIERKNYDTKIEINEIYSEFRDFVNKIKTSS